MLGFLYVFSELVRSQHHSPQLKCQSSFHQFGHILRKRQNNNVYGFCKYCNIRYFNNATRMSKHLASCDHCPDEVRLQFQEKKVSNLPHNVAVMETSALSAAPTSSSSSLPGLVCQPQHEPSAGTSAAACISVLGSTSSELVERQTTVKLLSTCTRKASSSLITGFCDQVSTATQKELDESFARAVFATGTPLSIVESPFWKSFFTKLRPAYRLPTRYVLSHTLLDREDKRISNLVSVKIAQAECLAIVSDGWTSVNNTPIVNFVITTPEPVFLKSVTTGENSHTGQYIAQLLRETIDEVGANKVMAVVTDNAANMKSAWGIITDTDGYKHIHCYGCVAHGLQLLATDICSLDSVDKLLTRGKNIIKFVKYKHIPHAAFERIQHELTRGKQKVASSATDKQQATKSTKTMKPLSLILPSQTRWGTHAAMLQRLLATKKALQHLVMEDDIDNIIERSMKSSILDNSVFWQQIENLHAVLQPVADAIKTIETDSPVLSDVPRIFFELRQSLDQAVRIAPITKKEEKLVLKYVADRQEFSSNILQRVANMLDPKYCGCHLSDEEISEVYAKISELASTTDGCTAAACLSDLAEFRAKAGLWKNDGIWEAAKTIPARVWWTGLCANKTLALVASRVLSLPATSASAERNWSVYKHVQSAKRNRLTDTRARKLVNIASNLKLTLPVPNAPCPSAAQKRNADTSACGSEPVSTALTSETEHQLPPLSNLPDIANESDSSHDSMESDVEEPEETDPGSVSGMETDEVEATEH